MKLKAQAYKSSDVIVQGHGSIILLWPQHDEVKDWFEENVEILTKWGEGIVVEPEYVSYILRALNERGFSYE